MIVTRPLVGCPFHYLNHYVIELLMRKRSDPLFSSPMINEVDFYQFEPSALPENSQFQSDDQVWYFFHEQGYRDGSSEHQSTNRKAGSGYWKMTGKGCDIIDKNCKRVGRKRTLVFYKRIKRERSRGRCPESKTDWVMHEFYVEDSPLYKKNFVICYIQKKPRVSIPGDGQPSPRLASDSVNQVIEDTYAEVQSQELHSRPAISDTVNFVTENTSSEVAPQPVSSQLLDSDFRNHAAENIYPLVAPQQILSHSLVFENIFPWVAPQPISSHSLVPDSRSHLAENIFPTVAAPPISTHSLVPDSRSHLAEDIFPMVESSPCTGFGSCNGLIYNSSAQQMPINPEQGSYYPYPNGSWEDINGRVCQLDSEFEDVAISQQEFQDEYPREGTGRTLRAGTDDESIDTINELYVNTIHLDPFVTEDLQKLIFFDD